MSEKNLKQPGKKQKGFALVMSVMILAFVVLLMLSLTTLIHVKSSTAGSTEKILKARENARLGLMMALGQLQKYAGPDQRVTATAEILDDASVVPYTTIASPPDPPVAITTNVFDGNRYWTGVWDSSNRWILPLTGAGPPTEYGRIQSNLGTNSTTQAPTDPTVWLISGGAVYEDYMGGSTNASETEAVTPEGYPGYVDSSWQVAGVTSGGESDHVILVGKGTVATNSLAIVVPKVSLEGSQEKEVGNYAFWVGDEGVKARLNLTEGSSLNNSVNGSVAPEDLRLQSPTKHGVEIIGDIATSDTLEDEGFNRSDTNFLSFLSKVFFLSDLGIQGAAMEDKVKEHFHDLTTFSRGLLTDTHKGGLQEDLTVFLEGGDVSDGGQDYLLEADLLFEDRRDDSAITDAYRPRAPFRVRYPGFHPTSNDNIPTFAVLKSWYDLTSTTPSRPQTESQHGFHPIIARAEVPAWGYFDITLDVEVSDDDGDGTDDTAYMNPQTLGAWGSPNSITLRLFPVVTLWNPYNVGMSNRTYYVAIECDDDLIIECEVGQDSSGGLDAKACYEFDISDASGFLTDDADGHPQFVFRVDARFEPGEAKIFSLPPGSPVPYTHGMSLEPGWSSVTQVPTSGSTSMDQGILSTINMADGNDDPNSNGSIIVPFSGWGTPDNTNMKGGHSDTKRFDENLFTNPSNNPPWQFKRIAFMWGRSEKEDSNRQVALYADSYDPANITANRLQFVTMYPQDGYCDETFSIITDKSIQMHDIKNFITATRLTSGADLNAPTPCYLMPLTAKIPKNDSGVTDYNQIRIVAGALRNITMFNYRSPFINPTQSPYQRFYGFLNPSVSGIYQYRTERQRADSNRPTYNAVPPSVTGSTMVLYSANDPGEATLDPYSEIYGVHMYMDLAQAVDQVGESFPLFDIRDGFPVTSMAMLQHVQLGTLANNPNYAIGNSYVEPTMGRERYAGNFQHFDASAPGGIHPARSDTEVFCTDIETNNFNYALTSNPRDDSKNQYYDMSYLANEALWDRFYLSGADPSQPLVGQIPLPNTSLKFTSPDHSDYTSLANEADHFRRMSYYLYKEGAFNINSTSVEAWKAVLASSRGDDLASGSNKTTDQTPFPRFLHPQDGILDQHDPVASNYPAAALEHSYNRIRALTDEEIDLLAHRIVEEVKLRGPFRSVADFVNRRMVTPEEDHYVNDSGSTTASSSDNTTGLRGPLQASIDRVSRLSEKINNNFFDDVTNDPRYVISSLNSATGSPINDNPSYFTIGNICIRLSATNSYINPYTIDESERTSSPTGLYYNTSGYVPSALTLGEPRYPTAAGIPGFLMQADILTSIGSKLSARSDTFRIRAYGEVVNPVSKEIEAKAWCEALVQRVAEPAEYTNPSDPDAVSEDQINPPGDFGRKFRIVNFRWLNQSEV